MVRKTRKKNGGKVIDSGHHKDLMNKSKLYKSFYEKQIQK